MAQKPTRKTVELVKSTYQPTKAELQQTNQPISAPLPVALLLQGQSTIEHEPARTGKAAQALPLPTLGAGLKLVAL